MSEETTIWLARHGETLWNLEKRYQGRQNSPLSPKGLEQARAMGDFLRDKPIEAIYTSPLGRAMQTAEIIQEALGVNVEIMNELMEMCFGIFEGEIQREMKQKHPDFFASRQDPEQKIILAYPDGESYQDVWQRLVPSILGLRGLHEEVLVVAHNSVNKVIRGILLGANLIDVMHYDQANNQIIKIKPEDRLETVIEV